MSDSEILQFRILIYPTHIRTIRHVVTRVEGPIFQIHRLQINVAGPEEQSRHHLHLSMNQVYTGVPDPEEDPEGDDEEDPKEDPADYPADRGDDDDDNDAEEEEHLAPADPAAIAYSAD
ncbi:hypothetical protein Tco_0319436 [Tanacetum coccineum]